MIKVKKHDVVYRKRNPVAREVRTEKYKMKVIPDKRRERKEKDEWKELVEDLRRR
jgi:transcriptional regulator of NAD metabolism